MGLATSAQCTECEVTTRWMGFVRIWQGSGEAFDMVDLFLPDVQITTQVCLSQPATLCVSKSSDQSRITLS